MYFFAVLVEGVFALCVCVCMCVSFVGVFVSNDQ